MFSFRWYGGVVSIAPECSGVRSVVALLGIAALLAFGQRSMACRVGLFGFAVLYALLGNALRIGSILAVCPLSRDLAFGAWHDYSGYLFFIAAVFALAWTSEKLKEN